MAVPENEIIKIQKGLFKLTVTEQDHLWVHYERMNLSTFILWRDLTEEEARATKLFIDQVNTAAKRLKESLRERLKLPISED